MLNLLLTEHIIEHACVQLRKVTIKEPMARRAIKVVCFNNSCCVQGFVVMILEFLIIFPVSPMVASS